MFYLKNLKNSNNLEQVSEAASNEEVASFAIESPSVLSRRLSKKSSFFGKKSEAAFPYKVDFSQNLPEETKVEICLQFIF